MENSATERFGVLSPGGRDKSEAYLAGMILEYFYGKLKKVANC